MSECDKAPCSGASTEPCGAADVILVYKVVCSAPNPGSLTLDGDVFATSSPLLEQQAAAAGFSVLVAELGLLYARRPFAWVQAMYEGTFARVERGFPVDVFWLWTQEIWNARTGTGVVGGLSSTAVSTVVEDFLAADAASKAINASFRLASSGWTLGPMADRAYFDKALPAGWTLTSIDEDLGQAGVEAAYAAVTNHTKWVIPWAEDDPHLGATQLWVGRTLEHMTSARGLGVEGALLITWRMEAVAPTIWALAHKAWDSDLTLAGAWAGWAAGEFGLADAAVASAVGAAFAAMEGVEQALSTSGCPGFVAKCSAGPASAAYVAKVHAVLALSGLIPTSSAAAQDRWRYWTKLFRYVCASIDAGCLAAGYPAAAAKVRGLPTVAARRRAARGSLVPLRGRMVAAARNMTTLLAEAAMGPGEMGMLSTLHDILLLNRGNDPASVAYGANLYGTFRLNFHRFDRCELDLRGHTQP